MELPALTRLPVPVFMCDEPGTLTFTNEAWFEELGTPVGEPWDTCFTTPDNATHSELWRQCVDLRGSLIFEAQALPNGKAPIWFEILVQPALNDNSQWELFGALINVTQQTLAAAEAHAILTTAVDAIVIIDEDGTIENFNQAASAMFGYPVAKALGSNVSLLMAQPHSSRHGEYVKRYLDSGEPRIIGIGRELEAKHSSGRTFPIYLAVSEIHVAAGRRRFTGIVRDLTEQHASREALAKQREKLAHVGRLSTMGEMTASIAHEINQPLTAISMYSQAGLRLLDRGGDPAKLRDALEKLNVQALRAGAVIERIQRFARAQEGVRQFVNLNDLIQDLIKLAESDARLHDIELALDLAPGLPDLNGDPIQIQQVLLNLIRNAIDAMIEIDCRHGRRILIRSRATCNESAEVAVVDRGPGVDEDQADLLFTPFHTTKKEGMGMGLSICRSIIAEHGGNLDYVNNSDHADPETRGPGATFYFRLPGHDHE